MKLLNRTTRRVGLTEAGHAFLASIRPALAHIDEAMEHARQSRDIPGGTLRLTVPRTAATLLLQPNLAGFMRDYPDIRLDIDVNDGFVDLINERFDAGIRFGDAVQLDMNVVPLGDVLRPAIVASPAYLARFGTPLHLRNSSITAAFAIVLRVRAGYIGGSLFMERNGWKLRRKPR